MAVPPKPDPEKYCEVCGERLHRKRFKGVLESNLRFSTRRTCGQSCGNTKSEVVKDTLHWRARKHLGPACETCGTTERLHVHHRDCNPANNDPANLETLCASCHLRWHWRNTRRRSA